MERETELRLIDTCLARLKTRAPAAEETRAPVDRYLAPDRFEREVRAMAHHPALIAHLAELPPGGYLTKRIFGVPLLLTRDGEGEVRGFFNVCRHRGATLMPNRCGSAQRLVCPYHAWTYDLAGRLERVPFPEGFPTLDYGESGLVPVAGVEVHAGLVFVTLRGEARPGFLPEALMADLDRFGGEELVRFDRTEWVRRANWKLLLEGALESYHFFRAHEQTVGKLYQSAVSVIERFGSHFRAIIPRNGMRQLAEVPRSSWPPLRAQANILYSLLPVASVLVQADHFALILAYPEAIDRTRMELLTLVPPDTKSDDYWAKNHTLTSATLEEDFSLAEQIQQNLGSGAQADLRFGGYEGALTEAHRAIDAMVDAVGG